MLITLCASKDAKQVDGNWSKDVRSHWLGKRWEILDSRATTILFGHPELRQQFEVGRLIERIQYVPVSFVTCVMAAVTLVLSVAR